MLNYLTTNTIIELICFIIALICLTAEKDKIWKLMVVFLFITCLTEIGGKYVYYNSVSKNNHWVYNIYILFEIGFLHLMYAHLANIRLIIIGGLIALISVYMYDMFTTGFFRYSNHTFTLMSVIIVIYSLYYYYLLFKDDHYVDLRYSPAFWWVAGNLFFYFGSTACNLFEQQLKDVMLYDYHLNFYIFRVLNIILYGCWSYSFICKKWLTTK